MFVPIVLTLFGVFALYVAGICDDDAQD